MYARGVTAQQLEEVAALLNFTIDSDDEGYRVRFKLHNESDQYWSVSRNLWGNDRTYKTKVCYHGHYEFLSLLFYEYPDATVDAGWYKKVRYTAENFEELAEEVGNVVIREYDRLTPRDKCNCGY